MSEHNTKVISTSLFILHIFVGLGGAAGGLAAVINPFSPMGVPVKALVNSPFSDFFIPGLILLCFIGLGNILGALTFHFKIKLRWYTSVVLGGGLTIWIVVQCYMLSAVAALHVIFFVIGSVKAGLALLLLFCSGMFPFNILRKIVRK